jgi:hypothetical protein
MICHRRILLKGASILNLDKLLEHPYCLLFNSADDCAKNTHQEIFISGYLHSGLFHHTGKAFSNSWDESAGMPVGVGTVYGERGGAAADET